MAHLLPIPFIAVTVSLLIRADLCYLKCGCPMNYSVRTPGTAP